MYCFPCLALPLPTRYPYPCLSRHRPPFYSLGKCCPLFSSVSLFHKNLDKYVCIACTAFQFHFYSFPSLLEEKHLGFSLSQFSSLFYYSFFTLHDGTQWSTFFIVVSATIAVVHSLRNSVHLYFFRQQPISTRPQSRLIQSQVECSPTLTAQRTT